MQFFTYTWRHVMEAGEPYQNENIINLNVRALFQLNDRVLLQRAIVTGYWFDISTQRQNSISIHGILSGNQLNPTYNLVASDAQGLAGTSIIQDQGIVISDQNPFYANNHNEVELPSSMQYSFFVSIERNTGVVNGDIFNMFMTIGYDVIKKKNSKFERV